jgi:D-sedoheptulose 7-phosphate isomerase
MNETIVAEIKASLAVQQDLLAQADIIASIAASITAALRRGRKVLTCGNGGSAADAEHLAAELVGRFLVDRAPERAIALTANTSLVTAIGNDYGFEAIFARQIDALADPGDVLIAISTSGNTVNVLRAVEAAQRRAVTTIGLTGSNGGSLRERVALCLCAPSAITPRVQEAHRLAIHCICALVEADLVTEI